MQSIIGTASVNQEQTRLLFTCSPVFTWTKKSFAITARDIPVDKMFLFCRTVFCLLIFALINVKGISGYGMYSDNVTNKALMKLEDLFIISNDTFYSCSSVPWI